MSKTTETPKETTRSDENESYEQTRDRLKRDNDFIVELDKLQPQKHNWVDRGLVMSCEFAGHPNHRSFKMGAKRK